MAHNASVLIDWANREAEGNDEKMIQLAQELQQGAVEVRLYSLLTLLKLRFWLLLPGRFVESSADPEPL